MSLLGASNITWIIRGLLVAGLIIGVWWLKGRVDRSYEADKLEAKLVANQQTLKVSEDAKAMLSGQLMDYQEQLAAKVKTIKKTVKVFIPVGRDCDLPPEVVKQLNKARGYE